MAVCCHSIAAAHDEGLLKEFIVSYVIPIDCLVRSGIPESTSKKANERGSKRKCQNNSPRDVAVYGDRVLVTAEDANEEVDALYELVFVHSTSATTCCRCKGCVRDKPSVPLPPVPYNLFIRHEERRVYNRAGKLELEGVTFVRSSSWN